MFSTEFALPYIIFFSILFCLSFDVTNGKQTIKFPFVEERYFIYFVSFCFFLGLRGFIASDWDSYYKLYEKIPSIYEDNFLKLFLDMKGYNIGFIALGVFSKSIFDNYFLFQLLNYLIDYCLLFSILKREIPNRISFGFLFYFIFGGMIISVNLLRNAHSIFLFMYSIKYIREKRFKKYFLINLIGVLFHTTSVLYIPLYFFLDKEYKDRFIWFFFIIGNFLYIFQIKYLVLLFNKIAPFLPNVSIFHLILLYLNSDFYSSSFGFSIGYLERTFTFVLFMLYGKELKKNYRIYLNLFFFYIFSNLFGAEMRVVVERIPLLFICSYWILYPYLYSILPKKRKGIYLFLFFIYSLLKLKSGYSSIVYNYDNAMNLNYQTYETRKNILDSFTKQFLE